MSRTKDAARHGGGSEKHARQNANKVQLGRVAKPSDTPVAHSKKAAKATASKLDAADKLNRHKKPEEQPLSESESGSSSDSDTSQSDSESDVSSSASDPVSETEKKPTNTNGVLKNKAPAASKGPADESNSGSESDSEASSDSSDSEEEKRAAKPAKPVAAKSQAAASDGSESDSEDESESDDDNVPTVPKTNGVGKPKAPAVNGKAASKEVPKAESSESSEDDDESEGSLVDSDSASEESDSEDDEPESEAAAGTEALSQKKRKASGAEEPAAKKAKIDPAASKTLFVGNLSWNVDDEWLRREFEEFGELVRTAVMTHRDSGKSKGFGFVEFTAVEAAADAHAAKKDQDLDGRPMNVDFTTGKDQSGGGAGAGGGFGDRRERTTDRAKQFGDTPSKPSNILWCGNLSFGMTSQKLQEAFEEYGTITRVNLPTKMEDGQLKGFGYVDFASVEEAQAAYDAMSGQSLEGRPVRLDFATPRGEFGGGGRGGRGGRGDFGGRGGRGDFGGRGGRGGRGDFGGRGGGRGRGGPRGGRGTSTNRGGVGNFSGTKITF